MVATSGCRRDPRATPPKRPGPLGGGRLPLLAAVLALAAGCAREGPPAPVVGGPGGRAVDLPAADVVVRPGDSLFGIARAHGVPLRDLIEANRAGPPYVIRPGQVLRLPASRVHVVEPGDTLSDIALCRGVDLRSLVRRNGLVHPYLLRPGDRVQLTAVIREPACRPSRAEAGGGAPVPPEPRPAAAAPPEGAAPASAPPRRAGKHFLWPVEGRVASRFGAKPGGLRNDGINIAASAGAPVRAAENGVVVYAGDELPAYGNLVLVRHEGGWMSAYAHNAEVSVARGQEVARGQRIASVGSTGNVSGPQVHFELRSPNGPVDPLRHLEPR